MVIKVVRRQFEAIVNQCVSVCNACVCVSLRISQTQFDFFPMLSNDQHCETQTGDDVCV